MQLDSEDLVHQFQQDWPEAYETSILRLQVRKLTEDNDRLTAENERLNALQQPGGTYTPTVRPSFIGSASMDVTDDGGRHGG